MLTRDFVGGFATIVIGAVYLYFAYQLRVSALDDSMGPGGLPRIYGWLLVALGSILVLQGLFARRLAPADADDVPERGEWEGQGRKIAYAFGLFVIAAGYILIVESIGYLPAIALLIIVTALYLGAGFSGRLIAIGVFGAVFLYAMFVALLGVRMPAGLLAPLGL